MKGGKYFFLCFCFLWLPCLNFADTTVAILGESYSPDDESGINEEVLARLFSLIKKQAPEAVIFTGNLTLGLKPTNNSSNGEALSVSSLNNFSVYNWPKEGYQYDSSYFKSSLERFLKIKEDNLGNIPFWPIIGRHETFGEDAITQFKKLFHTPSQVPGHVSALAYSLAINNAYFVLFSLAESNEMNGKTHLHTLPDALLEWLEGELKDKRKQYDYVFVIGNEPAFPTTEATGTFFGLGINLQKRNAFWRILINNKVNAYFCSYEHLYDRTNRYGIWQIISGGAGAPYYSREYDKAFYHYLLLILPSHKEGHVPKLQVYDSQGNLGDEFLLVPTQYPVYQLRIS